MVWKNLKKWLGMLIGLAMVALPKISVSAGRLEIVNYSSTIPANYVQFRENGADGLYIPYPSSPSLEVYYQDSLNNKYSTAGVNLSTNKSYNCPLEGKGTIPDGTQNDLAFKVVNSFPSNTLVTASVIDGTYSNSINDVIAFYNAGTKDAAGYVHFSLPATTNASNKVYGNVRMTFSSQYAWTINKGNSNAVVVPGTTNYAGGTTATQSLENIVIYDAAKPGKRWVFTGETTQ